MDGTGHLEWYDTDALRLDAPQMEFLSYRAASTISTEAPYLSAVPSIVGTWAWLIEGHMAMRRHEWTLRWHEGYAEKVECDCESTHGGCSSECTRNPENRRERVVSLIRMTSAWLLWKQTWIPALIACTLYVQPPREPSGVRMPAGLHNSSREKQLYHFPAHWPQPARKR